MEQKEDQKRIFTDIYENNKWGNTESVSGSGSTLYATRFLIPELHHLLERYEIKSILDIPCGDFNWMKKVNLDKIKYHGADIVESLIFKNRETCPSHKFSVIDLINDPLPKVDMIFCRDCLFHLPNDFIINALKNIKLSGSKYLLTTSYAWKSIPNTNCKMGKWRRLNLELSPFSLPPPIERIIEGTYRDKTMSLWLIDQI